LTRHGPAPTTCLEKRAAGLSSRTTSASGSTMAGLLQTKYGLPIVGSTGQVHTVVARPPHARPPNEDRADHRLFLRLWTGNRAPFPGAGLARRRHHAH